ncbi:MAG: GAF domain-containing protein [Calditrichaeota bacterium]|nr:MAG: GAF domain-containing protein [Calditrichota bacterium]
MTQVIDYAAEMARLEGENQRLQLAVQELSILNEIAVTISSTFDLKRIIEQIVHKCIKHLKVDQGAVMVLQKDDENAPFQTMVREVDSEISQLPFRLDMQLTGWMLKYRKPLRVNDFSKDERFQGTDSESFPIQSLLSVPLMAKGRMIGVVTVFNKRNQGGFTDDDQRLLSIIAAQSAQVIENARLYLKEQALVRMQKQMHLANEIQIRLLPKEFPQIAGYEIFGISQPAQEVGGDYFDFIPRDDGTLAFALGDVTGKGIPAAILMANLQAIIRTEALMDLPPSEVVRRGNFLLHRNTDSDKFVTMFYGCLRPGSHELCYCNAGHDHPMLIRRDGTLMRLGTGGTVLGFVSPFPFEQTTLVLAPGDLLVIYSDGLTEAMNPLEEEFGEERLAAFFVERRHLPLDQLQHELYSRIEEYAGGLPQADDMTLVMLRRQPEPIGQA